MQYLLLKCSIDLSIGNLALISLLGVIMAAGVPGEGIMMSAIMMQTMGLPLTIVPWVAGIYRLIDMPNTMLNITGDQSVWLLLQPLLVDLDRETFDLPKGHRLKRCLI